MADGQANIGVIGAGWWASQFHIPSLQAYEKANLVAVADPDAAKLAATADHYGITETYADYQELLSSAGVDGVVIAVPHVYHHEIAKAALDGGVHVLVEKPMVLTAADARDLVDTADAANLHLMVGTTYQFTRNARQAQDIIQSGKIGTPLLVSGLFASMVESYYRGNPDDYAPIFQYPVHGPAEDTYSDPKIAGGGQGQTQLSHGMGMVFWVTGLRAVEVSALMENRDLAVDLVDAISYRFDNGAIGTMGATGSLAPGQPQQQEFRYYGTEGFVLQELIHGKLAVYYNDGTSEEFPDLGEDELYPAHLPSQTLADLILGGEDNPAPGRTAAATVEFLEAAYRSAEQGRAVLVDEL